MTVVPVEGSADVPRHVRTVIVLVACVLGFALGGSVRASMLRLEGLAHAQDPLAALPAATAPAHGAPPPGAPAPEVVLPGDDDLAPPPGAARAVAASTSAPAAAPATGPHRTGAPLPARSGEGRRIVYQKSAMHVWVVDADGTVLRDYPVTGRPDRPRPGTYRVYSKSPASVSATAPRVTFRWMVRFAHGTTARIGFHDIPRWASNGRPIQAEADLGDPIGRGGCVRQSSANARWLYEWAAVGTAVVVLR